MGGVGSGRHPALTAPVMVGDALALSITAVVRQGLLSQSEPKADRRGARTFQEIAGQKADVRVHVDWREEGLPTLRLEYGVRFRDTVHRVEEPVELTQTMLSSHGRRWWFTCPSCNRRVGKLHLPPGQLYFACRHCHQLTYDCRHSRYL